MLEKFKSLFQKGTLPPHPAHLSSPSSPLSAQESPAQCPFVHKQPQPTSQAMKCPVTGKAVSPQVDSDSEEEKPKGGCPFMSGTSDKKKNPDLKSREQGFQEPFVSKFRFYLSTAKLDFSRPKRGLPQPTIHRQLFDKYPIYLQHSLFFNGQDYRKVRSLQCCSRFMAYEQLREKGNKRYNKGKFYQALDFYERAISLFKWIEYAEPTNDSTEQFDNASSAGEHSEQISENGSRVNIPLEDPFDSAEDSFEELKKKYKEFFITYTDDNTRLFDGNQLSEDADIDMRKSLLIQGYLNMCAAYIQTHHYSLALQVCNDGLALSDKVSQLYFRKAQALSLRKDATMDDLKQAQKCIMIALEKKSGEKIFATANTNILKMLNIHDADQAYLECKATVEERMKQTEQNQKLVNEKVYSRVKQINLNEKRIIEEGKVPKEGTHHKLLEATTEMKILSRMTTKYVKVIEFYTENKNQEQVKLAKNQFQEILRINSQVKDIFSVRLEERQGELGGLDSEKVQRRVDYVKTQMAENIYNNGKFNFTMLEWAIKEIVKEEKAEQEANKKKELEEKQAHEGSEEVAVKSGVSKMLYFLLLVPIFVMLLNMFVL